AAAQLLDQVDRDVHRERHPLVGAAVPHRPQVLALDEVHREEQLAADLAGVEHRDQVAVAELDHHLGLVAEPGQVLGVGQVRQDGLDDQELLEAALPGDRQVQRSHPPLREGGEQVVLPELARELVRLRARLAHGPRSLARAARLIASARGRAQDYHAVRREPIAPQRRIGGRDRAAAATPDRPDRFENRRGAGNMAARMAGETILVIDDSATILKVVQLVLTKAGFRVETASDGEAGLATARQIDPDLILLDFVMPRMNGYQVCRALAADADLCEVPVVLMSAKGDQVGERFVRVMGIVDDTTKPFSPEAITAVVQHTVTKSSQRRSEERTRPLVGAEPAEPEPFEAAAADATP